MNRYYLIPAVIYGTRELVTYIDAQPASIVQYAKALRPNQIQIVDITFVTVIEPYLILSPIVLKLPVGWGSNNQVNGTVGYFAHLTAVTVDYLMFCYCHVLYANPLKYLMEQWG
jgi:hypothetical protein